MGVTVEHVSASRDADKHIRPKNGQKVQVHYIGKLTDGTKIDSSRDCGKPFEFVVGQNEVIIGWDEGIKQMHLGETAKLTCTPDYAYGKNGYPGVIPKNATLIFEMELLKIL